MEHHNKENISPKTLIFMVEPVSFRSNEQTFNTNAFQKKEQLNNNQVNKSAHQEFQSLANKLIDEGISIHIEKDLVERDTPDSIFPNNWVSFHQDGTVLLYPMQAENRRRERSLNFIHQIAQHNHLKLNQVIDLSYEEENGRYLEGTGSIVFDHHSNKAYACLSERTDKDLLLKVCDILKYKAIIFHGFDKNNFPIYHTNVMMAIGKDFAVICSDSITDKNEKQHVIDSLKDDKKEIIKISFDQMNQFCGNIIELKTKDNKHIIAMSETAFNAFDKSQKEKLSQYGKLVYSNISTIETHGGGSVRCMICEVS